MLYLHIILIVLFMIYKIHEVYDIYSCFRMLYDRFESSLDRVKGQALIKVAAVADVAKGAMKDAATLAVEESKKLAKRWAPQRFHSHLDVYVD